MDLNVYRQQRGVPKQIVGGMDNTGPAILLGDSGAGKSTTAAILGGCWVLQAKPGRRNPIPGFQPERALDARYPKRQVLEVDGEGRLMNLCQRLEELGFDLEDFCVAPTPTQGKRIPLSC